MTLHECLLKFLDSNEIKIRVKNKQIKLNGEPVIDSKIEISETGESVDLGDLLFWLKKDQFNAVFLACLGVKVQEIFGGEPFNLHSLKFLSNYNCVTLSKREHIVFKIKSDI